MEQIVFKVERSRKGSRNSFLYVRPIVDGVSQPYTLSIFYDNHEPIDRIREMLLELYYMDDEFVAAIEKGEII